MSFRWRYLTAAGAETDGPDEAFDDQPAAEDWFGAEWPALRDAGVDAVTLVESTGAGDRKVYGPMSLHET